MITEYDICEYLLSNLDELKAKSISKDYSFLQDEIDLEFIKYKVGEAFSLTAEELYLLFESHSVRMILNRKGQYE